MVALAKSPPKSMTEMLLNAQKYMNAEDALAAIGMGGTRKEKKNIQEDSKGKKRERGNHSSSHDNVRSRNNKTRRKVIFTPLVMPVDKILMQTKDNHPLK